MNGQQGEGGGVDRGLPPANLGQWLQRIIDRICVLLKATEITGFGLGVLGCRQQQQQQQHSIRGTPNGNTKVVIAHAGKGRTHRSRHRAMKGLSLSLPLSLSQRNDPLTLLDAHDLSGFLLFVPESRLLSDNFVRFVAPSPKKGIQDIAQEKCRRHVGG